MVDGEYFYILLFVSTGLIIFLTLLVWFKTKNPAFLLGIGFVYFWSIFGAWSIVHDRLAGYTKEKYVYLYNKLFPIYLNTDYFITILYYAVFMVVILITVLFIAKYRFQSSNRLIEPIRLSNLIIIIIALIAFFFSFMIELKPLMYAYHTGKSGYAITRSKGFISSFYTLHQVLNRVVLLPSAIGLMALFSGKKPRYFTVKKSEIALFFYIAIILGMTLFCYALGNKNELFLTLIIAGFFYYINAQKPRVILLLGISIFLLGCVLMVDFIRGGNVRNIAQDISLDQIHTSLSNSSKNDEKFGAHFSLYGAINFRIKPTYGSSVVSLALSVVPRIFWPNRPDDIYAYYANNVHATPGQGYSIHHATGWYLNFGFLGIVIGGIVWGWAWAILHNNFCLQKTSKKAWYRIFIILAPWSFTAGIPSLVRAGIEGYKGLFVDCFIFPVVVLTLANYMTRRSAIKRRKPLCINSFSK